MRYFLYEGLHIPIGKGFSGPRTRKKRIWKKWLRKKLPPSLRVMWYGIYEFGSLWDDSMEKIIRIEAL